MGFLSKLRGETQQAEAPTAETHECVHGTLVPRWDSADDMGKADRVSYYNCEACGAQLSPEDAAAVREREAEILQA